MKFLFMNQADGDGNDLNGGDANYEQTKDERAQEIINQMNGDDNSNPDSDDVQLPSDNQENKDDDNQEDTLLAGKYKDRDSLLKGIENIGNDLPEYIINGMSDEALATHYKELEKNFGKRNQDKENKDRKYSDENNKDDKDENSNDKVDVKSLWTELENEFNRTGKISNEIYDKLEEAGIPSNIVDSHADKLVADSQEFTKQVLDIAGGEEIYNTIKSWAEENYSQEQLDAIVALPRDSMLIALQGIKSAYEKANPVQEKPNDRLRGNSSNASSSVYNSQYDYLSDVKNPKYGKDPIYTKKVEEKLKRSKF